MKNVGKKIFWITGASSGIGKALALQLAAKGARLVLSARNVEALEQVQQQTGLTKPNCLLLPLDLADNADYSQQTQQVIDHYGRIDCLLMNGGISQRSYFADTSPEVFRRLMEVNFFGNVSLTRAVLPHMLAQEEGLLVAVSSVVGKFGTPLRSGYSASKHALHGFFEAVGAEHYKQGLRTLLVCPGYINTNISINALTADGSPQGTMDKGQAKGMSAEDCAAKIISGIEKDKREIYPGGFKEVGGVYIKRFFPSLLRKMLRKVNVTE